MRYKECKPGRNGLRLWVAGIFMMLLMVAAKETRAQCPPTITPSPLNITVYQGNAVVLTASPAAGTYEWYRNDIQITGATTNVYNATQSGVYKAKVTGCANFSRVETVTINANPVAAFTASDGGCANLPVAFAFQSTGTGLSYSWSFNDPASGEFNSST